MISISKEEEEILSKFATDTPIKLSCRSPTSPFRSWVFWSQEEEEEEETISTSDLAIRNQIKTALSHFNVFLRLDEDVLVQFWAPTTTTIGGLTTSRQPFALNNMNEGHIRYRNHCVRFEYCGDGISGRVFRNQVNEFSPNVSHYSVNDYPLRDLALSCGITKIMALPIFQHQSCVGVLELLFSSYGYKDITYHYVRYLYIHLERGGLNLIYPPNISTEQIPKQIQEGVDHVTEEIRNALQHARKKFRLPLACAWVRCKHSTSMGHCGNLSCTGELVVSMPKTITKGNWNVARVQAMRVGHGLLGNIFLSPKPYFCRDVTQLSMSVYPMAHAARKFGFTSCFAIGLQSIATGNRDYALEFFLPKTMGTSEFHSFLFSILAILKQHLKSFEAVTGHPADDLFIKVDKSSFSTVFESSKTCPTIVTHIESGALQNEGEEVLQANFSCPQLVMNELVENGNDSVGLEQSQVACLSKEKRQVKKSKVQDQKKESSCSYETLEQHFGKKLEDAAECLGSNFTRFIEVDKFSFNTVFESLKTCPNISTHIESGALQNEGEVLQADFSCPQLVMKELAMKGSNSVGLEQSQVACLPKEKSIVKKSKAQDLKKESLCSYETLKQHFGMKLEDAAESLGVSRSTVKRWCRDNDIRRWPFPKRSKVCSAQPIPKQINAPIQENVVPISESSVRDPSTSDLPTNLAPKHATMMTVKATYRNDIIKFQLCFSSRMRDLVEKVILRLKLSEGTFNIKYQDDDGDYILIACDEDLEDCMKSFKLLKETPIKMLIEPLTYIAP